MGALRKAGVWLGLVEDEDDRQYDDADYDDFDEDDLEPAVPAGRSRSYDRPSLRERDHRGRDSRDRHEPVSRFERERERLLSHTGERSTVRPIGRPGAPGGSSAYAIRENLALAPAPEMRPRSVPVEMEPERAAYQITTLHPTTYNEARTIGEHFRDGVPVIINLTELDEADAKRLVDFAAGLAFGLRGSMDRIANRVFLLSPANVQVTAEDKARIAEGGFFTTS
jgi:cell division inhibitor SepF